MTGVRAIELPVNSVVVDDDRSLVWIAVRRPSMAYEGRWKVSGSESFIADREIDAAMLHTAHVLRIGDGAGR